MTQHSPGHALLNEALRGATAQGRVDDPEKVTDINEALRNHDSSNVTMATIGLCEAVTCGAASVFPLTHPEANEPCPECKRPLKLKRGLARKSQIRYPDDAA